MSRIYISSSWKNQEQPFLVEELRKRGHKVYDFRHPCGRDDNNVWIPVSNSLGLSFYYENNCLNRESFRKMLTDKNAINRFNEHFKAMQDADTCILLLPCGRSSHVEAGFMNGQGKRVFVMDTSNVATPELMYLMFDDYFHDYDDLFRAVEKPIPGVCRVCGCTDMNPCYHPDHGNCWWVDDEHTLCSHCADLCDDPSENICNDPQTVHCINDLSEAFK